MRLSVKVLGGEECDVIANPEDSVEFLKREVENKLKLSKQIEQKLLFRGKALQDGKALSEYKLIDGSKINLLIKRRDAADQESKSPLGDSSTVVSVSDKNSKAAKSSSADLPAQVSALLDQALYKALRRHFQSDSDTKKVVASFKKLYSDRLSALSLDDLERVLSRYNRTKQFLF